MFASDEEETTSHDETKDAPDKSESEYSSAWNSLDFIFHCRAYTSMVSILLRVFMVE